ncbi:MAG: L17 family ribosomal protein [Planctomycetota bacterium]
MRHRRKGRKLGRNPKHQRALLRNLASSLILTERDAEFDENAPKVKGRIVTTISKAKEVRPLVEKCITIARRSLAASDAAADLESTAERGSQEWKSWRQSDQWQAWNQAIVPAVNARRRCVTLLGNKEAVEVLFEEIAPRFADRPGGYTRIIRLAQPRLGDSGQQAILEFVGVRDRVVQKSEKPAFDDAPAEDSQDETSEATEVEANEDDTEDVAAEDAAEEGGEEAADEAK